MLPRNCRRSLMSAFGMSIDIAVNGRENAANCSERNTSPGSWKKNECLECKTKQRLQLPWPRMLMAPGSNGQHALAPHITINISEIPMENSQRLREFPGKLIEGGFTGK